MKLHRVFGDAKRAGNLAIAQTVSHQHQHLELARCQVLDEIRDVTRYATIQLSV